jgi:ketosteroid isomerase-like protein
MDDASAIRGTIGPWCKAALERNWDALIAMCTSDVVFAPPGEPRVRGNPRWIGPSLGFAMEVHMSKSIDEESRLIRAVWDDAVAALIGKDWDRYSQFWAHDGAVQVLHSAERDWTTGWEQIAAKYQSLMESPVTLSGTTRRFEVTVSPAGDVAWAIIEADMAVDGVEHRSWEVAVFRKIDNRWKAVLGFDAELPSA